MAKKTIKTYGVKGITEWHAIIPCKGGVRLKVHFTEGAASADGWVPARYKTADPIVQMLIESSEYFKKKRITLVSSYTQNVEETPVARYSKKKAAVSAKAEAAAEVVRETVQEEQPAEVVQCENGVESAADAESPTEGDVSAADDDAVKTTTVKVSDIESEGRQYLITECGIAKSKLLSKRAVEAEAARLGIVFELTAEE